MKNIRFSIPLLICTLIFTALPALFGQAAQQPATQQRPTSEEVRKGMGIPSTGDVRGQQDAVGFASKAEQMAKVWDLSAAPPPPEEFGPMPAPGVAGIICPHDDYLFAGRLYRKLVPLITAKTVVLVGVFHKYRRFAAKDVLVLDPYRAWRSPDGEIPISDLRWELLTGLSASEFVQDAAAQDGEHSLEAIAYWLKHQKPDLEILPIIVPSASFPRFQELAAHAGRILAAAIKKRGWTLGREVAVVISSDGIHYGADFKYTPYGDGGVSAYVKACDRDRELLRGPLAGEISTEKVRDFYSACVNSEHPDEYRMTWCGRFSIPFGMLLLQEMAKMLGRNPPVGIPMAYGTSIGFPELPFKNLGMGATAPANLYHFVSYPGVALTIPKE